MPTYASRSLWTSAAVPPPVFDSSTLAWVAAVIANGGTVSGTREQLVDDLIVGLKDDGVWTKLDRLWLFAAENEEAAEVDLLVNTVTTPNSSPTFTADLGYTGNGSTSYVDTNFNAFLSGVTYTLNSCCAFGWNVTAPTGLWAFFGARDAGNVETHIEASTGQELWNSNADASEALTGVGGVAGLYTISRTAAAVEELYINGVSHANGTVSADSIPNQTFRVLTDITGVFSAGTMACFGAGGGLTDPESTALYDRLNTYMTAVGL